MRHAALLTVKSAKEGRWERKKDGLVDISYCLHASTAINTGVRKMPPPNRPAIHMCKKIFSSFLHCKKKKINIIVSDAKGIFARKTLTSA